jgi:hypothetical protein
MDAMIRSQGYSTRRFKTLQGAYYNKPTPLQRASFHTHLINIVRAGNYDLLDSMMGAGISPNPCNSFGESLVHMVSRRGDAKALRVMIDHGCSVQVADDYGRTPLHDCCWATKPAFDVAEYILETDVRLLHMTDCRGASPLSYVRKEHWAFWIEFLESKKDIFWPQRDLAKEGEEEPPALAMLGANTRPLPIPANVLTLELAVMVVSGKMQPNEAKFLQYDGDTLNSSFDDSEHDNDDNDDSDDSDESDDSDDCNDDTDFSLDEDELAEILSNFSIKNGNPVAW